MKIKVCGIHNLENLKQVLALQPDFIGLNFYSESKRFCKFASLPDLNFGNTKVTGVFVNSPLDYICNKAADFNLSFIQLHGTESAFEVGKVKDSLPKCKIVKVFGVEEPRDLNGTEDFDKCSDFYLFDKKAISFGGTGKKFDWDILHQDPPKKQFFLAGGIGPEDVRALKLLSGVMPNLFAVDINSRFEDKTGLKVVQAVGKFIEELR